MTSSEPLDLLQRTVDRLVHELADTTPEQAALPTPCIGWDVRGLTGHVLEDLRRYNAIARGDNTRSGPPGADPAPGDPSAWAQSVQAAGDSLLEGWRAPGAMEQTFSGPMGDLPASWRVSQQVVELAIHTWDLLAATGRDRTLDEEVAAFALEWVHQNLKPEFRSKARGEPGFGPEVAVEAGAPISDRFAGFMGRDPQWLP